jgi:hypothetical protein
VLFAIECCDATILVSTLKFYLQNLLKFLQQRAGYHLVQYISMSVVTSGISRSAGAQSFGGAHRGRVCVRVFIGVSVCACCERLRLYCVILKKKNGHKFKILLGIA